MTGARMRRRRRLWRARARSLVVTLTSLAVAVVGLVVLAVAPPASAAATLYTWTGGAEAGNQWSNPQNWDNGTPTGEARIYIPGGSGTMTNDLNPSSVSIEELSIWGTWNIQGAQININGYVFLTAGSQVNFQGGLAGENLDLDLGSNASCCATTVHISGQMDVTGFMRIKGWSPEASTVYFDGTESNRVNRVSVNQATLHLAKPDGVTAARRVDAVLGNVRWDNDRQLQDFVETPTSPDQSQAMLYAYAAGQYFLDDHEEVVNQVWLDGGSKIDLGGGSLTAESVRTGFSNGGRADITNGTFRFSKAYYDEHNTVTFQDGAEPIDLRINANLQGAEPLYVDGSDNQIPLLRLGDADEYSGPLTIRYGTVCAAQGYAGTVTETGGVFIDERQRVCEPTTPPVPPDPPGNFTGDAGDGRVTLSWTAPANTGTQPLQGYHLMRGIAGNEGGLIATLGPEATSYPDEDLQNGTDYQYWISAYSAAGESTQASVIATPQTTQVPPGRPQLTALAGDRVVRLEWTTPTDPGTMPLTQYVLYRSTSSDSRGNSIYSGDDRAYLDTELDNGTTYYYTVFPMASETEGESSGQVAAQPSADTGALKLEMKQLEPAYPGRNTTLEIAAANEAPDRLEGPFVATVILPAGIFGIASTGGAGWTCGEPRPLGGRSLLTCTNPAAVEGMAEVATLSLTLSVPQGAARATYPISYSMAAQGRAASSDQPFELVVADPKPAHLSLSVGAPQTLSAEEGQDVSVVLKNTGAGATVGGLSLQLSVPAGVTVDNLRTEPFWGCSMTGALMTCTSDRSLTGGGVAPAIVLSAKAPATENLTTYVLTATARGTDAFGAVQGTASARAAAPVLPKPAFSIEPSAAEDGTFRLTVENTGGAAATGIVSIPLRLPLTSMTVDQLSDFGTWSCETLSIRIVVVCKTVNPVTLAPGDTIAGPQLSASASIRPGGASTGQFVTLTGNYAGSAYAQVSAAGGKVYKSPSTPVPLPTFAPPQTPTVSTQAEFKDSPLFGLHKSSITFSLKGNPNGAFNDRAPFVLLLPPSLDVDGTAIPSLSGYPSGTPAPSCEIREGTYAGGFTTAVVCLMDRPTPAGAAAYVTVPFTAIQDLGGQVKALTGIVRRPAGVSTPEAILNYAWARLGNRGGAALSNSTQASVNGITFNAQAGPPQRVDAGVLAEDGTVTPTRVVLSGSASAETIVPLNFGWVQTAGPPVTWEPPAAGGGSGTPPPFPASYPFAGGTVDAPDVFGKKPAFAAPPVTEHTEFVFELYVTDGKAVTTSVTTVAIDPLADNPPAVTSVVLTDADGAVLSTAVAPAAGQELQLHYATSDPERDPVAVVPSVVRPGELRNTTFTPLDNAPAGQQWFSFRWPEGVSQAVVEAVLTDGKTDPAGNAVSSRHSLVIGPDPAPLGINLPPPEGGIDPGGSLTLTANLTNPVVGSDTTAVTWTQLSGPTAVLTPDGSTVMLRAPPTARPGDSITVQALARRGTGSSAPIAKATVTIAVVSLAALGLGPVRTTGGALPASVPTGSTTPLTLAVSGGRAPYSYAWQVVSGGGSLADATTDTAGFTAPGTPGLTTVAVTVTDASGASARQTAALPIGTLPSGTLGAQGCDPGGPLRTIYDAAAGLAGSDHVSVTFGALHVDLGTKNNLLGGATTCSTQTLFINGGAATVSGIGFTGFTGSVNALGLTISSATVTVPGAWRLTGVQLSEVRFGFTDYALLGSLTASMLPVVASTGAVTQASTTLTLGADRVTLVASARLAGAPVSLAGVYCFSGGAACANPPPGVVGPVSPGAFAIHATAGDLRFLGHTLSGGGDLTLAADGTLTGAVELVWTGAPSGDLGINEVRVRWSNAGLKFHAGANLGGRFTANLDGDYLDEDDWSADVSGGLTADWTPAPGLALTRYNPTTGTGTGVEGSVAMKGGQLTWAVTLRAGATWTTGPLTVRDVSLTLGSGTAAPAGCGLTPAQQQNLYLDVKGIAEISWGATGGSGGTKVSLNIETCIVPDVGWTLTTTTPLTGVQITNGLDLTGVTFTAAHRNSPDQTSYVLNATGNAFGVSGAVTLALISPAVGDSSYLADMRVDLDDLGLPVSGEGHLLYASRPIADLGAIPGFDLGFAANTSGGGTGGCAGATPGDPLAGLPVAAGFTALSNFKMPASLCGFLKDKIGVPVAPSLVVSVNMSGTPVITASISAGPEGYTIFQTDDGTKLTLKRIKLSISLGGSFGLMADADLALAKPTATSPTDVSVLQLSAGVTIQLAGVPSITVVLQKTGDAWENAFGVNGLKLGDLAIQGGVVFSGIPTPSIGFGAQILDMPSAWKNTLGIIPTASGAMEPVQLVLNISLSNPILDISLGSHDGHDFMRPLRPISTSIENAVRIDYAQLVIAPFGGDVGSFHYDPGFHIGFAMTLIGVKVDVRADLDMTSGRFAAHAKIGAFGFGPVSLDDTTFDLEISPANGGLTVGFSSGFRIGSIRSTAVASVQARVAGTTPQLKIDFDATLGGVNFGPIALEQLKVFAHTNLSGAAAIANPLSGIVFGGTATVRVLTVPLTVFGTITMSTFGGITGGDLLVTSGSFSVGPLSVGGSGCKTSVLGYLPPGVNVPTNGPCLQVGIHPGTSNPYYIKASGAVSVAGLSAKFDGTVDNTGIAVTASIQVASAASVSVNGRIWGGPGINGSQRDYNPVTGTNVVVRNGDFRVHGATSVNLTAFRGNLSFEFGNLGGTQFAMGSTTIDVLKPGVSPVSFSAALKGTFSRSGSFRWDLSANGTVYVANYKVASAAVRFTQNSFTVNGSLAAGPVNASVNATLSMNNGFKFSFGGNGSINVIGLNIGASVLIRNTFGPLEVSAQANLNTGIFNVNIGAWFSTSGAICLWGSANVGFGNGNWPDLVRGSASFCTQNMNGIRAGIHANFWVIGMIGLQVDWSSPTRFTAIGGINIPTWKIGGVECFIACGGAEASFGGYTYLAVATHPSTLYWGGHRVDVGVGISFAASAKLHIRACILACVSADVGFLVQFNPTRFCATVSVVTACLGFSPLSFRLSW